MDDRQFWMLVRQAVLLLIDAIETRFKINPRTAELRKFVKAWMDEGRKKKK